jgi:hypothetical protein
VSQGRIDKLSFSPFRIYLERMQDVPIGRS